MTWEMTCLLIKIDLVMTFFFFFKCVYIFKCFSPGLWCYVLSYSQGIIADIYTVLTRGSFMVFYMLLLISCLKFPKAWNLNSGNWVLIWHFINVYKSTIIRLVFFLSLCLCWNLNSGNWGMRAWHSVVPCIYVHSGCEATSLLEPV